MAKYREFFNINLGKRLRDRRIEMGFRSQESFAEALGLSRGAIALWETGENGISDDNYPAIKRVLKVDDSFFASKMSDLIPKRDNENVAIINRSLMERIKTLESKITPEIESLVDAYLSLKPASRKVLLNTLKKLQKSAG